MTNHTFEVTLNTLISVSHLSLPELLLAKPAVRKDLANKSLFSVKCTIPPSSEG